MPSDDRDLLLAHHELVCPRCGNLRSVCSDPSVDWHPHSVVCWPSATAEWGLRRLQRIHKSVKADGDGLHPLDGVRVVAAPVAPEVDEFVDLPGDEGPGDPA